MTGHVPQDAAHKGAQGLAGGQDGLCLIQLCQASEDHLHITATLSCELCMQSVWTQCHKRYSQCNDAATLHVSRTSPGAWKLIISARRSPKSVVV